MRWTLISSIDIKLEEEPKEFEIVKNLESQAIEKAEQKDFDFALSLLEDAKKSTPNNPSIYNNMSSLLKKLNLITNVQCPNLSTERGL